jgi:Tfp pilus assembly protein PilF
VSKGNFVYTDLDQLSNKVPGLIQQGKFDQAENICKSLMEQFPDQIDGFHRYAEFFEAKGDKLKAAEYYRKTAEFARKAEGFEEESIIFFQKKADELAKDEK